MNKGDEVISLVDIPQAIHMFPKKYETPNVTSIPKGTIAKVEEVYPSGFGIVKFEGGIRLLVKLKEKFIKKG